MNVGYYNGKFAPTEEITIPLSDRSIYFGDGVYDVAIGRNGCAYHNDIHVRRLIDSANKLGIKHGYTAKDICDIGMEAIKLGGESTFLIYYQISRSAPQRRHSYNEADGANLLITVRPTALPSPDYEAKLVTYEDRRYRYCNMKTLNLLPSVLASSYAAELGADEAIFHRNGTVTECAHSNIAIIKNGRLITHPEGDLILAGVAREDLILKCAALGIPFSQRPFTLDELYAADEVLITSSSKVCIRAKCANKVYYENPKGTIGARLCSALYEDFVSQTE